MVARCCDIFSGGYHVFDGGGGEDLRLAYLHKTKITIVVAIRHLQS